MEGKCHFKGETKVHKSFKNTQNVALFADSHFKKLEVETTKVNEGVI